MPAAALPCSPRSCTHVPLARTRFSCPVRSSALLQLRSRACCTNKALLPCTFCALSCTHVPAARTRLSCPVRSSALLQLHSRACCTHKALLPCTLCALSCTHVPAARTKLSCLVRSLAPSAALTCPLHAQALLPCALPCACLLTCRRRRQSAARPRCLQALLLLQCD